MSVRHTSVLRSLRRGAQILVLLIPALAAADAPYGLNAKPALQGTTFPDLPPVSSAVVVNQVFPALQLAQPVYVTTAPGDDSTLYVVTRTGLIWKVPNTANPADSEKKKLLDLSAKVLTDEEQGLLGLAFDADFATNQKFYVYYSTSLGSGGQRTQLSEFTIGATPQITLATEKSLLKIAQTTGIHKGGCLQIGPDKKIYLTVGDGGPQGDPDYNAQSLWNPKGKVLRLNTDGSFPADNPFVGQGGASGAVWALGFRNPWRCGFDRSTGELWVGDVGLDRREEIDKVRAGGNYGWRLFEGDLEYNNWQHEPASNYEQPILAYAHTNVGGTTVLGNSVVGGYVYRGSRVPGLAGKYVFTDYIAGDVWALTTTGANAGALQKLGNVPGPVSFGTDNAGNLYIVSIWGQIYRLDPADQETAPNFPTKLSQTGLFTDLSRLTPTTGLIEYEINAPFWSDGAIKRRWVGLVAGGSIGFQAMDPWTLPKGSLFVKHFDMALSNGTIKRLETRVLINQKPGWRGYTYRWNDAGTDADLIDGTQTVTLSVMDPTSPTGARSQTYEFPSRGACSFCHNNAGPVLGFRALEFNRDHKFANGVTDNQLRAWNHVGAFNYDLGDIKYYTRLKSPDDTSATLAERARSYLDANCSQCHRPDGPTQIDMDLRAFTGYNQTRAMGVAPTAGDLGIADARRIQPGSKEKSIVWQRMKALNGKRMPPIGSHAVDQAGVDLIGAWIDAGATDGYDFNKVRPMYGGNFTATRNGLKDVLNWSFANAQGCTLKLYNSLNKNGKLLGNFGGTGSYTQDNKALKNTYSLGCFNPYSTDWWSITLGGT